MMLKDKFSKFFNNSKKTKDPMKINIMDGFVDIKGYKVKENGKKEIVYHDCGDNVVTDWMRQIIMLSLTGTVFSNHGTMLSKEDDKGTIYSATMPNFANDIHNDKKNLDGYILNDKNFFESVPNTNYTQKYSTSSFDNEYSLFPTKVLFGTGKEYHSWELLKAENEVSNNAWYNKILSKFGSDEETAKINFNNKIYDTLNTLSGTITSGVSAGDGTIIKTRSVDSNLSLEATTNISTNRSVGVSGAIKTLYLDTSDTNEMIGNDGNIDPAYEGVGRPSFIYFRTPTEQDSGSIKEAWNDSSSDIFLSKDDDSKFINKITFTIRMPSQSADDSYYPYNGHTLRQIGLYNDALLKNNPGNDIDKKIENDTYLPGNMPCGTLLAIKNIPPVQKSKDLELVMTWTLTI